MNPKDVKIKGNGYELAATLFTPEKISELLPAVVFYHGMPSQRKPRTNRRAQQLAEHNIVVLTFDFRGCGESNGDITKITYKEWLDDALLGFDFLSQQSVVDKNRVGISGKSFGGYMGAMVSEKRNVASMVLHAPATYDDNTFEKTYTFDKTGRIMFRKSDAALKTMPIRAIEKYKNPLLIVGSEFDDLCPKNIVEGYFNHAGSAKKELKWILGADHPLTKPEWDNEYVDVMVNWFVNTL